MDKINELINNGSFKTAFAYIVTSLLSLMTVIQISPIKLNPWSWLANKIGRAFNGELIGKVDNLDTEIRAVRSEAEKDAIINCRVRILRFGDELMYYIRHTKDHFDQTLQDIDRYEMYCSEHPEFMNSITVMTIERIREVYGKLQHSNDFM